MEDFAAGADCTPDGPGAGSSYTGVDFGFSGDFVEVERGSKPSPCCLSLGLRTIVGP